MSRPRAGAIRKIGLILVCLLVAAAATAYAATRIRPGMGEGAGWREVEWRMPLDNWGTGLVWRGNGPGGAEILLFARTKTGFCNCFDGIADDNEIDRIGDVDLHGADFFAMAPGQVADLGVLPGRQRAFRTESRWGGTRHVVSMVAASDCKAVVATLVSAAPIPPETEAAARVLLTGPVFRQWAANR